MIDALKRVTQIDKFLIKSILKEDDIAIDLTCGNGNDTLFLANTVGESGKVYAFDIQKKAIEKTRNLLEENNLKNYILINDNHSNLLSHIKKEDILKVKVVMLNLGYLPNSDHSIKTDYESSLEAIKSAIEILSPGGIITICIYPHKEGKKEEEAILEFVKTLTGAFNAYELKRLNRNNPPYLLIITRD